MGHTTDQHQYCPLHGRHAHAAWLQAVTSYKQPGVLYRRGGWQHKQGNKNNNKARPPWHLRYVLDNSHMLSAAQVAGI
jgi:hypothetical protein